MTRNDLTATALGLASFCAGSASELGLKIHLFREAQNYLTEAFESLQWDVDALERLKWIINHQLKLKRKHPDNGHTDMLVEDESIDYLESLPTRR